MENNNCYLKVTQELGIGNIQRSCRPDLVAIVQRSHNFLFKMRQGGGNFVGGKLISAKARAAALELVVPNPIRRKAAANAAASASHKAVG